MDGGWGGGRRITKQEALAQFRKRQHNSGSEMYRKTGSAK